MINTMNNPRTLEYYYPDESRAANLKVCMDRVSPVRGFYFTRENIDEVTKQKFSKAQGIYFLFDNSESDSKQVYVGQSINGVLRIYDHVKKKDFWSKCMLFVTDNNRFDKLSIDYMEQVFIQKFRKSSYTISNRDLREKEVAVNECDRLVMNTYIKQIEFMLGTENVSTHEVTRSTVAGVKSYFPKFPGYKAELFVQDGKFVLAKGSELRRPVEDIKERKDNMYEQYNKIIDQYIAEGKVEEKKGKIILLVNLEFDSPSRPGCLVYGRTANGWTFFDGLSEIRP